MSWSNEVTLEFLQLYEQERVIWNPKDPLYKSRSAAIEAWTRISDLLSIQCSITDLKKKKESLMATFRPLLNKVKSSIKAGNTGDDAYKPSWFAYEAMAKFLGSIYHPRPFFYDEYEDVEYAENEENDSKNNMEVADLQTYTPDDIFISPPIAIPRKRKRDELEYSQNRTEETHSIKQERDECSLYMELLETKLRAFDTHSRDNLMHEIDNLVFRFKVQKRNSSAHYNNQAIQLNTSAASCYKKSSMSPGQSHCSANPNSLPEICEDRKPSDAEVIYISQSSTNNATPYY